jgi:uncharacterized membrane protein YgcG
MFSKSVLVRGSLVGGVLAVIGGCTIVVGPPVYQVRQAPAVVYTQPAPPPPAPVVTTAADPALQQLVAPIALYPDPLIANILPGCTYPDQVMGANEWVQSHPNPAPGDIEAQDWDPSIKALAHYPTVLSYMAGQPDWMKSLGSAFSENQANVFAAIQDLREQAKNNGNLTSNAYADVVVDGPTISIQPTDPTVIYVPSYDPVLVYQAPFVITYGPSFVVGPWFVQGVDWYGGVVFVGDWHGGWAYGSWGWRRDPYFHGYYNHWGHNARWGPRPFVARDRWAYRPEARGFRPVVRSPERMAVVHSQNERAAAQNRANYNNSHPGNNPGNGHGNGEGGNRGNGNGSGRGGGGGGGGKGEDDRK